VCVLRERERETVCVERERERERETVRRERERAHISVPSGHAEHAPASVLLITDLITDSWIHEEVSPLLPHPCHVQNNYQSLSSSGGCFHAQWRECWKQRSTALRHSTCCHLRLPQSRLAKVGPHTNPSTFFILIIEMDKLPDLRGGYFCKTTAKTLCG
jgi:hypothetical protein